MRGIYEAVIAGEYERVGLARPVSGPSVYRRLACEIADAHGLDPLSDPELIARAEGIHVVWGATPQRHGIHYGSTVIVSPMRDPREAALVLNHERAHHWYRRLGAPHATEADVIWLTIRLSVPAKAGIPAPNAPAWLLRAVFPEEK